jgi:hypothetical protein
MNDKIEDEVEKELEETKVEKIDWKEKWNGIVEFAKVVCEKIEVMNVKLDENLPRKSYIFWAMTFAVLAALLGIFF